MPIKPSDEEEKYFRQEHAKTLTKLKVDMQNRVSEMKTKEAQQEAIEKLGFTDDTVRVLDLVPLVQVAWADGEVSDNEKELIMQVVEKRGIKNDDRAWALMETFLARRPTDEFFDAAIELIRRIHDSLPQNKKTRADKDLVEFCVEVADASGGILGFNRIDTDERKTLKKIVDALGSKKNERLQKLFKGV